MFAKEQFLWQLSNRVWLTRYASRYRNGPSRRSGFPKTHFTFGPVLPLMFDIPLVPVYILIVFLVHFHKPTIRILVRVLSEGRLQVR